MYVKSKDLDLWHVITNGDFQPIENNTETKLDKVVPFENQSDELKKRLAKNNKAKMVIYNALPRKEYERIFICYSSKNYVRKFLRDIHLKWRIKVTTIEESKDLTSLSLDELIGNLKVHEMIIKKDSKIVKAKGERISLALKAKKESKEEDLCDDPNHLLGECLKPPKEKNQRAFVGGSWSDSSEEDDEKAKDETCLMDHASSEVCFESSYFSDENSSVDDIMFDSEYYKFRKLSLTIIFKNKHLKSVRNKLEKELSELKEKLSKLEKNKGVDIGCTKCQIIKIDNEKLKEEAFKLTQFEKSTHSLNEILSNQKPSRDKSGLGFYSFEASSNGTKKIKFVKPHNKTSSGGDPQSIVGGPHKAQTAPKAIEGPPVGNVLNPSTSAMEKSSIDDLSFRAMNHR
ncbi:hypothetical protein Tco_0804456 [Tanacetum coccineum]|uniref:UBN2 domain-containing protein n=1 Tax=Tanacetum coccineum TaxID=301880 RepID=A0ABQ5A8W5_9ASTR